MDTFKYTKNLGKLNHEDTKNLNRPITNTEIESVIQTIPTKKRAGQNCCIDNFYHTVQEELISILKLFKTIEKEGILPNFCCEASVTLTLKPEKDAHRDLQTSLSDELDVKVLNTMQANEI